MVLRPVSNPTWRGLPGAAPAPPAFEVEGLAIELAGRTVLSDVSFSVQPGERVVLLGVNGCGKTTLLKALDGLVPPARGEIRYAGDLVDRRALDDASFRRRFRGEVALLFQNVDAMLFNPTVADEIAFGPRQLGLADVAGRVAQSLDVPVPLETVHNCPVGCVANGWIRVGWGAPPPEEAHTNMLWTFELSPLSWATEDALWQERQKDGDSLKSARRNLLVVIWQTVQFPPVRTGFQLKCWSSGVNVVAGVAVRLTGIDIGPFVAYCEEKTTVPV